MPETAWMPVKVSVPPPRAGFHRGARAVAGEAHRHRSRGEAGVAEAVGAANAAFDPVGAAAAEEGLAQAAAGQAVVPRRAGARPPAFVGEEGARDEIRGAQRHGRGRRAEARDEVRRAERAVPVRVQHQPAARRRAVLQRRHPEHRAGVEAGEARHGQRGAGRERLPRGKPADEQQRPRRAVRSGDGAGGGAAAVREAGPGRGQAQEVALGAVEVEDGVRPAGAGRGGLPVLPQHEQVRPGAARQRVRAGAAVQRVVARAAEQRVLARFAAQQVRAVVAFQAVAAAAATEQVGGAAAEQGVGALAALQGVGVRAAEQGVVPVAAGHGVVAGAAVQQVVAAEAEDGVVPVAAREGVGGAGAGEGEGAGHEVRRGDRRARRQVQPQHEIAGAELAVAVGVQHQPAAAVPRRGAGKPVEQPRGAARRVGQGEAGFRRRGRGEGAAEADRQERPAAGRREGPRGDGVGGRARRLPAQRQQVAGAGVEVHDAVGGGEGGAEKRGARLQQHEAVRPGAARQRVGAEAA